MKLNVNLPIVYIGAAFHFISGTKKQAPKWIGDWGFQWLFRLINEPILYKRYFINGGVFAILTLMKFFSSVIKRHSRFKDFILIFILNFFFILPQYFHYSSLLDVLETFFLSYKPINFFLESLFNEPGRLRPTYYLYRFFLHFFFGEKIILYFLFNTLILSLIQFIIIKLLKLRNFCYKIFLFFFISLNPITVDNFWRLGTAEPLFTLLLLVLIYITFTVNKNAFLPSIFLFFFGFSKETSIFFILYFSFYFFNKNLKISFFSFILFFFILTNLLNKIVFDRFRYAYVYSLEHLSFNISNIENYFLNHPIIFGFFLYNLLTMTLRLIKDDKIIFNLLKDKSFNLEKIKIFFILSLFPVFFFNNYQDYYLFPGLIFLFILLVRYFDSLKRKSNTKFYLFLSSFLIFFGLYLPGALIKMDYWNLNYRLDSSLIKYIDKSICNYIFIIDKNIRMDEQEALHLLINKKKRNCNNFYDSRKTLFITNYKKNDKHLKFCIYSILSREMKCKWQIENLN